MIGKNDENSRSWVEDIYWTHFKALHFAQFLRTGYDQHLVLPKTFSDNVKKLPENVDLRGPSGVVWNVGLTSKDDTVFFMNGWRQFFKDHSLKENDFLVFKYNGEALFDVLIFDGGSFCEKASSYFVRKSGYTENGGACLITGEVTDNSVPKIHALSNAGVQCASPEKSVDVNDFMVLEDLTFKTPTERAFNAGVKSAPPEKFMEADEVVEPAAVSPQTTGKRTRKQRYAVKSIGTVRRGRAANGSIGYAVKPIRTVRRGRAANGSSDNQEIVDLVTGEKSVVGNDFMVLEDVTFKTPTEKAFDAGVESASPEKFMEADEVAEPAAVSPQTTGKRTRKQRYAVKPIRTVRRRRAANGSNDNQEVVDLVTDPEPADPGRPDPEPASVSKSITYSSNRRPVTEDEIKNALELARAACTSSSLHIVMRPTHVYKRFFVSVPNKWILEHISPESQNVILRVGGIEWLAKYSLHNVRHTGGLTGGWKHFAVDNNLEEFDVCVLEPAGQINNTLILDVSIFRVVEEITPLGVVGTPGKRGRNK